MKISLENLIQKLESKEKSHVDLMTISYILIASFSYSLQGFLSKFVKVNSSQIVYYRSFVMLILNTIPAQNMKIYDYPRNVLNKIYSRCIIGCIGQQLFYESLKYISISDGLVLNRTTPIWTSLLSVYYLRTEKFDSELILIMIISFVGIILMLQPSTLLQILGKSEVAYPNHALGAGLMILVAVSSSTTQVLINQMAGELSQLVILQYFAVIPIILTQIANLFQTQEYTDLQGIDLLYLILIGILSYVTQLLQNRAYMKGELTRLTLVGQSQILFAVCFDFLAGHSFNELSLFGGALVIGSLVYLIIQKK